MDSSINQSEELLDEQELEKVSGGVYVRKSKGLALASFTCYCCDYSITKSIPRGDDELKSELEKGCPKCKKKNHWVLIDYSNEFSFF